MSSRSDPLLPDPARLPRLALVWLVLAAWPWIAPNDYLVSLGGSFFINLLLISGLNLLVGYAGQISLAQGGFFGLGAYTSGILSAQYGASPWLGLLAAVLCSALAALLVGLPTLRLRGHYLAMATVGLNAILSVLFVGLVGLTGGPNGLAGVPSFSSAPGIWATPRPFTSSPGPWADWPCWPCATCCARAPDAVCAPWPPATSPRPAWACRCCATSWPCSP